MRIQFSIILVFISTLFGEVKYNTVDLDLGTELSYIVELPADYDSNKVYPLIVGLHGYGGDIDSYIGISKSLCPKGAIGLYPEAILSVERKNKESLGYAWFYRHSDFNTHLEYINKSVEWILYCINTVISEYPIDRSKVFLYGFSQGGMMTYKVGLEYPHLFRGLMPGGALLDTTIDTLHFMDTSTTFPSIHAFHGAYDRIILPQKGRKAYRILKDKKMNIELYFYPIGHEVCKEMNEDCRDFVYKKLHQQNSPSLSQILYPDHELTSNNYLKRLDQVLLIDTSSIQIAQTLLNFYQRTESNDIREKLIYLLGAKRCGFAEDMLRTVLQDPWQPQKLRKAAYSALIKIGTESSWATVAETEKLLVIDKIASGSQADSLGLLPEDIILSFNDKPLKRYKDFRKALKLIKEKQNEPKLEIQRNGERLTYKLVPGEIGITLREDIKSLTRNPVTP